MYIGYNICILAMILNKNKKITLQNWIIKYIYIYEWQLRVSVILKYIIYTYIKNN